MLKRVGECAGDDEKKDTKLFSFQHTLRKENNNEEDGHLIVECEYLNKTSSFGRLNDGEAPMEKFRALLDSIDKYSLEVDPEGFILASGRPSTYIFNIKNICMLPNEINMLSELILDEMNKIDSNINLIAGMEVGAIPIITSVVMKSKQYNKEIRGFFVRKEKKKHGTKNLIEGYITRELPQGCNILIIDDVTTTGNSILKTIENIKRSFPNYKASGCIINHVLTVIDREEGSQDKLKKHGLFLHSLFKATDFERVRDVWPRQ